MGVFTVRPCCVKIGTAGKVPTESCSPTEQVLKGLVENQGATDEQIMNHPGATTFDPL